jgi:histidyl-tRNA synthetase
MVRGLDYYTKTVFEISHPKLGSQDALAAGGRYDHLIESFGGKPAGAVGFAVGVERLLMSMAEEGGDKVPDRRALFIAVLGEQPLKEGFKLLSQLRKAGLTALMDFSAKSLKSQMRAADKSKSRYVIILGEDELKRGSMVLKDMKDGAQRELGLKDAVQTLKEWPEC